MKRPEERLQRDLVAYLRSVLPQPWLVFAVPNGGGRSKAESGVLKAMGVMAGVPDLLIVGPGKVIAVELKAPPKRLPSGKLSQAKPAPSEAQRDVIAALGACGIPTLIVNDLTEAVRALQALGVPMRGRLL